MSVQLKNKLESFLSLKQFIFVLCISLVSIIMFCHVYDAPTLVTWWTTLLNCVFNNSIIEYQHHLSVLSIIQGNPLETNYPLFLNVLFSIYFLPLYIILHIIHQESQVWIYILWIKLFLFICNLCIARVIQLILEENHIDKKTQKFAAIVYLLSPFVQFFSLGMGQIDALGLFFALLCFLALQRNNYALFCIFSIISFLLKPFVIFIIAPLLIAMWHRKKTVALVSGGLIVIIYFLQNYCSDLIVADYSHGSAFWTTFVFMPRLMKWQICGIPIVAILLVFSCLIYFIWGYFKEINIFNILFCQTSLLVIFEALIEQHPQWFIYFAAVSIMLLVTSNKQMLSYIIFWLVEIMFCLNGIFFFDGGKIITSYGELGLLGRLFQFGGFDVADSILAIMPNVSTIISILLTIVSVIFLICILLSHLRPSKKKRERIIKPMYTLLFTLPTIFLNLFVIIGYIWQV